MESLTLSDSRSYEIGVQARKYVNVGENRDLTHG